MIPLLFPIFCSRFSIDESPVSDTYCNWDVLYFVSNNRCGGEGRTRTRLRVSSRVRAADIITVCAWWHALPSEVRRVLRDMAKNRRAETLSAPAEN